MSYRSVLTLISPLHKTALFPANSILWVLESRSNGAVHHHGMCVCVCVALMSDTYLWSPSSLVKAGSEAIDTPFDVQTHKHHPFSYHILHSPLFLSGPKHTHFSINWLNVYVYYVWTHLHWIVCHSSGLCSQLQLLWQRSLWVLCGFRTPERRKGTLQCTILCIPTQSPCLYSKPYPL